MLLKQVFLKVHPQAWDIFWQLKALWKWWKMLFISPQKLFSFSRYLNFCIDFLARSKTAWLERSGYFKFCDVTAWLTNNCHTHIEYRQYTSKANQTIKFGQLVEYNKRNIFLEKSFTECGGETKSWPFLTN